MPKPKSKAAQTSGGEAAPAAFGGADIGIHLVLCMLAGCGLGYALDRWMGWAPWGMISGGAVGFAVWLREIWRVIQKA